MNTPTHTHTVNATGNQRLGRDQHAVLKSHGAHPQQTLGSAPCRTPPPLPLEPEPEWHEVTQDLDNPLGPAAHPARQAQGQARGAGPAATAAAAGEPRTTP